MVSITNNLGNAESYNFTVIYGQAVNSPFTGQPFYGSTNLLQSLTQTATNLTTTFTYDALGTAMPYPTSGGLTKVTYPYGGSLGWQHANYQYSDETLREVQSRYLVMSSGGTQYSYSMARNNDSGLTTHSAGCWTDVTGQAEKIWTFQTDGTQFYAGLATTFSQGTPGSTCGLTYTNSKDSYTWAKDPVLRPYLNTIVTTLDPGQTFAVQKQTVQTADQYGNLLTQQAYNYGSPGGGVGSLARTYTNVYLNDSNTGTHNPGPIYSSRYIYNRLQSTTVTDGTNTAMSSNVYDNILFPLCLTTVTNMPAHDSAYNVACPASLGGSGFIYRGNLTSFSTPTSTGTITYDIGGNVVTSGNNGVITSTNTSTNSSTNYAAPSRLTTNSLSTSLSWSSFLGVTGSTGPNGDVASIGYDTAARPLSTTSSSGAVTTYGYAITGGNATNTVTTNGHWVNSQMDGFGRTIHSIAGYGTGTGTTVSEVDTVYLPCGCSPMGKVSQVSQPYLTQNTQQWTTYTYDALGRTLKLTLPDGSKTSYVYKGNTLTVTDAASHSKTFTMDAFGNLTTVQETDPQLGLVSTSYTYDVLNHLISVSMPRGSQGTQTRTFNYNITGTSVTGFLQSATNPENGTVTYTYDGNNLLASKTDAKGQQIKYTYDLYNRVTQVSHFPSAGTEDTSQRVTYIYDTNSLDTNHTFSNYNAGRVAAVTYGPVNTSITNPYHDYLPTFTEWYNYQRSGLVATKRLQVLQPNYGLTTPQAINFDAAYTYDAGGEGKILSVAYPATSAGAGPKYTYSFDSMYRPTGMTDQNNATDVSRVTYNPANQLLTITYFGTPEQRTYNNLNQLTAVGSKTYTYPAGANTGKISSQTDSWSGETVQYAYDTLNRLVSASSAAWSQAYSYDPFGTLTAKTPTGTAPGIPTSAVPSNTDLNGNVTATYGSGYNYDVENRMWQYVNTSNGTTTAEFAYDTQNRRVWQWNGSLYASPYNTTPASYTVYFYGVNGKRLAAYTLTAYPVYQGSTITSFNMQSAVLTQDTYFGGKRLAPLDRLGSATKIGYTGVSFYPYGEDKGTPGANDNWKFATYLRDSATGLDYAMNRYYSSGIGRFLSPDPYVNSAGPSEPQSWNRYGYTRNDPVNRLDPNGLEDCAPGDSLPCSLVVSSPPTLPAGGGGGSGYLPYIPGVGGGGGNGASTKCPSIPQHPSVGPNGANVSANVANALSVAALIDGAALPPGLDANELKVAYLFYETAPGQPQDYKQYLTPRTTGFQQLDQFGNFNFGAIAQALGLNLQSVQWGAGVASYVGVWVVDLFKYHILKGPQPGWGTPLTGSPYGDNPQEQGWIAEGFQWSASQGSGSCRSQ